MSLKDSFLNTLRYQAEIAGKTHTLYTVAEELGLLGDDDDRYYASENLYGDQMSITLSFYHTFGGTPSEHLAAVAKTLLPKLGEMQKEFDDTQNRISLTSEYKGVKIILSAEPPKTCSVEKVEEDVVVPEQIIPAHTEKKVRWVMKGDCDPLMQPATPVAAEAEGIPF